MPRRLPPLNALPSFEAAARRAEQGSGAISVGRMLLAGTAIERGQMLMTIVPLCMSASCYRAPQRPSLSDPLLRLSVIITNFVTGAHQPGR